MLRIISDLILFLGIFFWPWWVNLLLGGALIFFFRNFYEFLLMALFTDLLYGGAYHKILGIPFFISVVSFFLFTSLLTLKARLLIYIK